MRSSSSVVLSQMMHPVTPHPKTHKLWSHLSMTSVVTSDMRFDKFSPLTFVNITNEVKEKIGTKKTTYST